MPAWVRCIVTVATDAAPLLTLGAVVVSVLTLWGMRQKRLKAYEPQLFADNSTFWLQKNSDGTPCFLKTSPIRCTDMYPPPFRLRLRNIGLGAANTLTLTWAYDTARLTETLVELGRKTSLVHLCDDGRFEYLFKDDLDEGYGFRVPSPDNTKRDASFLMPGDGVEIDIPDALRNYLTFVPYLTIIAQGKPHRVEITSSEFSLQCSYHDISGKKHHQTVAVTVEAHAYSKDVADGNYGVGTLSFRRK